MIDNMNLRFIHEKVICRHICIGKKLKKHEYQIR
jgi:hypothetical protein